ncbi:ABC transporter permease [Devosia neptuniae]|uniref:ABC transporter permease n=1 Tax=Devosia neptuniae TaxID=191302 RepID=A0ABY6CG51_9HYPH|nr:ABC transporter permease [Devosia neptuniae]UXN70197.1 ABC transporter permease [Devosia neptuniae]
MSSLDLFVARPGRISLRGLRHIDLTLVLAWAVIAIVAAWAVAPGLFTPHSGTIGIAGNQLKAPDAAHWLGTDEIGRDVLARIIYGSVNSLSGAIVAVAVGLFGGTALGLFAGAIGGKVDDIIMRLVDVMLSIPGLLLQLSIIILLGFGTINVAAAVGVTTVASFARLMRSEVIRVRRADYVEAAFGSGGRFSAVLWRHVLPNSLGTIISYAALQFGTAILAISTLGFLGYGAPPPIPEWGLLISEGRKYLTSAWWLTAFPGLAVILVVLAANRISQSLRRTS